MVERQRAMLGGVFGLGVRGAAAAVKGGIAYRLLRERFAAIASAALDDAERAPLANLRPLRPIVGGGHDAPFSHDGTGELVRGARKFTDREADGYGTRERHQTHYRTHRAADLRSNRAQSSKSNRGTAFLSLPLRGRLGGGGERREAIDCNGTLTAPTQPPPEGEG